MADDRTQQLKIAIAVLSLCLVVLVGLIGLIAFRPGASPVETPAVSIGGPFELTAQDGRRMSERDIAGKPFAVFFGFTHCPDVCPTTLWEMSEALKALGTDGEDVRMLFIAVDSERDTPEVLSPYLQSFDPRIVGLSGTPEEIEQVVKAYRVFWEKVPGTDGDYTINHTASVFLMDAGGRFAGTISYGEPSNVRLEKLRQLIGKG